ncbi:hypothetical protein CNMCM5623_006381 [Aspergillus felis]|uniref:Putative gamma-glutamylcyclotransferase n=1 Tax=Aspergillus felis TaxID=1287682 RepID=A0A8H6PUN8_9EURO|nr:hypothetical protein CNMCM5623_006381 [Aspergillus felis]
MPQQSWNEETLNPPSNSPRKDEPSPYQVMLQSAPPDYLTNLEGATHELPPEYPVYYFFYGTLTVAANLKRIIDLQEEPRLRKAKIIGYALAKWGDYPALINGEPGQEVSGYAYLVQSEEEAQKLAYYETIAYRVADCWVFFTDGEGPSEAPGKTFMYAGDAQALLEQRFDRRLWTLQMGGKLG